MKKKIFTLFLVAVFMLAQFSTALAAASANVGSLTLDSQPKILVGTTSIDIDWSAKYTGAGQDGSIDYYLIWYDKDPVGGGADANGYNATDCSEVDTFNDSGYLGFHTGTASVNFSNLGALVVGDKAIFQFTVDENTCATAAIPAINTNKTSVLVTVPGARVDGDGAIATLSTFSPTGMIDLEWSVSGLDGLNDRQAFVWSRVQDLVSPNNWDGCQLLQSVSGLNDANGVDSYDLGGYSDQDVVEFTITVDVANLCTDFPEAPHFEDDAAIASTFIDDEWLNGFMANPPSLDGYYPQEVSCNTFEMWALLSDQWKNGADWDTDGFSGIKSFNPVATGSFAPPAAEGPANELFEWDYTFPASAVGNWSFELYPGDNAGNEWWWFYRLSTPVSAGELEDCVDFTDTAGHADETYIRYLADLELIAGNPDGSYGPDTTLTRAEAAALFEKANGRAADDVDFPDSAPVGCAFTDVSAADWFAGWVWAACEDGFMNGVGGGLFDPSNLLTRGQIVTIFNNIYEDSGGTGGFLDFGDGAFDSVLEREYDNWTGSGYPELREAAFTDVLIGAFYTVPVIRAYGVGIADATGATTFSPDQAILRGEFARMLYRALSADWNGN